MKERVRPVLRAILRSIEGIDGMIGDSTLDEYSKNWGVKHAVERGVEIISEASRRLPQRLREQQPFVEWKQIHGIGNVLRHDYDEIVDDVIYGLVRNKLPALKAAILAIEASLDEGEE